MITECVLLGFPQDMSREQVVEGMRAADNSPRAAIEEVRVP